MPPPDDDQPAFPEHDPRRTRHAGDPARWLEDHGDMLYHYALSRVRDGELARDLVQDTLLAAWKQRDRFEGRSALRSWLTGILRHKILDHWRVAGRFTSATDLLGEDENESALFDRLGRWDPQRKPNPWDPVAALHGRDLRAALADCIEQLPERLRKLFVLTEVEEGERARIAADFDISTNHLAVLIYRARQRLRLCLEAKLGS